jgi:hypothetical protein
MDIFDLTLIIEENILDVVSNSVVQTPLNIISEQNLISSENVKQGDCSICLERLNHVDHDYCLSLVKCNHIFHEICIVTWLSNHTTCPICRYDLLSK